MKNPIPEKYPETLEECLKIFENIQYKSYGFGIVFLHYDYSFQYWNMSFRNPVNFSNPDIKADSPLEACHQMLDFLHKEFKKQHD